MVEFQESPDSEWMETKPSSKGKDKTVEKKSVRAKTERTRGVQDEKERKHVRRKKRKDICAAQRNLSF